MRSYFLPMAALALSAQADKSSTTSATPTTSVNTESITFFDPYQTADFGYLPVYTTGYTLSDYKASVKDANPCASTFDVEFLAPGIHPQTFHIVDGPSTFDRAFSMSTVGFQATLTQSCKKDGTSSAVCTESRSISNSGHTTTAVITSIFTGDRYSSDQHRATVTAGGSHLTAATGSCTKGANAAAPTGLGGDVYKVVVVPALAAIAAVAV